MALEFPDDRTAWSCDQQFMLGSSLLVAPVFDEGGAVELYLPEGRWTNFWDDTAVTGPRWVKEVHGFGTLPLYMREGSILVLGKEGERRTAYDWAKRENHEIKVINGKQDGRRDFRLYDVEGNLVATLKAALHEDGCWRVEGL